MLLALCQPLAFIPRNDAARPSAGGVAHVAGGAIREGLGRGRLGRSGLWLQGRCDNRDTCDTATSTGACAVISASLVLESNHIARPLHNPPRFLACRTAQDGSVFVTHKPTVLF